MNSYNDYCKSFGSDEQRVRAELICCSRAWLSGVIKRAEDGAEYFGTDSFEFGDFNSGYDALSRIIGQCVDAFKYISKNLRDKIVRENALVPLYQAREINSVGMNWISRRPGKTVREKLSGTGSVMAVKRRFSFDTGENRLLVELLKDICELYEFKRRYLPEEYSVVDDEDFYEKATTFLRSASVEEIARWENLPPNNTLLSDRHYQKIWRSWLLLQELDELIKNDNAHIDEHLCTVAFWKIFSITSQYFMFCQTPVCFDYDSFDVSPVSEELCAETPNGVELYLSKQGNVLYITKNGTKYELIVNTDTLTLKCGTKTKRTNISSAEDLINKLDNLGKTFVKELQPLTRFIPRVKHDQTYVDFFNLHPFYCENYNEVNQLDKTIAVAKFVILGKEYELDLDRTRALNSTMLKEVVSPFSCHNQNDCRDLFSVMRKSLKVHELTFLFPDIYDEFTLSPYRRAARIFYNNVSTLPRSIAAAFCFEMLPQFANFKFDDVLLVADFVNGAITITLIKGKYSKELNEETNGARNVVWERFPAMSIAEIKSENSSDITYFAKSAGIKLYGSKPEAESSVDELKNIYLTNAVKKCVKLQGKIIGNSNIYVLALDNRMKYESDRMFTVIPEDLVSGCAVCCTQMKSLKCSLWRDHLPHLAIKLLLDKFDLIKDQTIVPLLNNEIKIEISNTFTLPAGKKSYRFRLLQEEERNALMYQAVITHKAFPLEHNVECRLDMRYRYGADEPYTLTFRPLDRKMAGFSEATVHWNEITEYESESLIYPPFPDAPTEYELRHCQRKNGVYDQIKKVVDAFDGINQLYTYEFTGYERWRESKDGFTKYILVDVGEKTSVWVANRNFLFEKDFGEYLDNIYFNIYEYLDDYTQVIKRRAVDIIVERDDYYLTKKFTSIVAALHKIVAGGRIDRFTDLNKSKIRSQLSDIMQKYTDIESKNKYMAARLFSIICLMHDMANTSIYDFLSGKVDEYIQRNYILNETGHFVLNDNIGLALGSCKSINEQQLFHKLCEMGEHNIKKMYSILSRAAWKNEDFILNAPKDKVLFFFDKAVDYIKNQKAVYEKISDKTDDNVKFPAKKYKDLLSALEFSLAVFRLRQTGDKQICMMLSPNSEHVQKLIMGLEAICQNGNKILLNYLHKSRIRLEIAGNATHDTPPILYALLAYANGENVGSEIIISGINDEYGDDADDDS